MLPSQLLGLSGIKAYYFDRGIWLFCSKVENEMAAAEAKVKNPKLGRAARQRVLARHIYGGSMAGVYKDPAPSLKPKPQPEAEEIVVGDDFFG